MTGSAALRDVYKRQVIVKVTDIDQQGRINLSRRDALIAMEAKKNAAKQQ